MHVKADMINTSVNKDRWNLGAQWPANLAERTDSWFNERHCLKNKPLRHPDANFQPTPYPPPHTHIHTQYTVAFLKKSQCALYHLDLITQMTQSYFSDIIDLNHL